MPKKKFVNDEMNYSKEAQPEDVCMRIKDF